MNNEQRWTGLSILICCLAVAAAFLTASSAQLDFLFGSDALYLPSIYHDLVNGAGVSGLEHWHFNPAPNFFPDMGVFLLFNWLLGDLRLATYVFAIVQVIAIIVLFRAILKESRVEHGVYGVALGVLLMSLLTMVGHWANDFNVTFQLLINSYHTGAFVNALLATWLLQRWFRREQVWELVALCIVVILAAVSDKLFWVMFVVPGSVACGLLAIGGVARRRSVLAALLVLACTWAADRGLQELDNALPLNIAKPGAYLAFDLIQRSWHRFVEVYRWYFDAAPLLVWCMALPLLAIPWAVLLGIRTVGRTLRATAQANPEELVIKLMVAMFFPLVLFAPVLNGAFDGGDSIRYNFAVFILAPLVLGILVDQRSPRVARIAALLGCLCFGLPVLRMCFTSDTAHVLAYRPERVSALDRIAEEHELHNGVADYWDAKVITLFSETGLNVLPVFSDLAMYVKVNREAMFYRSATEDPLVFDFVVGHELLKPENVAAVLDAPVEVLQDGLVSVIRTRPWIYDPVTHQPAPAESAEP